ncbi:Rrf2 family transcriptional regulator [Candidatus Parcubacteria bacterium]|nr:MAG: Rrf2 family transcriptional regulator [Candidatus Parcubacteria bacterium]
MRISRKIDYACILLAALKPSFASGKHVSLRAIAAKERLPLPFLEKVAGTLRKKNIIGAKAGAAGGYRLLRDPKKLSLGGVAKLFGEQPLALGCLRSEQLCPCPDDASCDTRAAWERVARDVESALNKMTVAKLS